MTYLPQSDYHYVRALPQETHTAGGLLIPEDARPDAHEFFVLASGPGRRARNGSLCTLQAKREDWIIAQKHAIRWLDYGQTAFISDTDLIAIRDEQGLPRAANEYVLIQPDRRAEVDPETKASVRTTASGLLVADGVAPGAELRERKRGQELYRELEGIIQSQAFREQPGEYYRHRMMHNFFDGLSPTEFAALKQAIDGKGETRWEKYRPLKWYAGPTSGTVRSVGRVLSLRDGTRRESPVPVGVRVHFEVQRKVVSLSNAYLSLVAVPFEYLAAYEEIFHASPEAVAAAA